MLDHFSAAPGERFVHVLHELQALDLLRTIHVDAAIVEHHGAPRRLLRWLARLAVPTLIVAKGDDALSRVHRVPIVSPDAPPEVLVGAFRAVRVLQIAPDLCVDVRNVDLRTRTSSLGRDGVT